MKLPPLAAATQTESSVRKVEISLLKRSPDELKKYRQLPRRESRSDSRGRSSTRGRRRNSPSDLPRLSKLRSVDRELLAQDRDAEIRAIDYKYRLLDKRRLATPSTTGTLPADSESEEESASEDASNSGEGDSGEEEVEEINSESAIEKASRKKGKGKGK